MASNYATDMDRSLGNIIKDLTADLTTLFRSEIALLKLEIKDTFTKLGSGAGLFAGALFLGLIALGVPAWVSSLIVMILLFAGAGVLAMMGKKKFAAVKFVPDDSIEHIKSDIDSIKADIARVR